MVAGGGGSPGCYLNAGFGGDGGDLIAENGFPTTYTTTVDGGLGGSQSSGYALGKGGPGEDGIIITSNPLLNYGEGSGAGGGGYYGGYGGKTSCNSCSSSGGGGGSSYISGHPNCLSTNADGSKSSSSVHFSGLFFSNIIIKPGYNIGDGKAIITGLSRLQFGTFHCSFFITFKILFIICYLN